MLDDFITCYKVVLISLIQSWYNKNVTRLTTQGCSNIVISWLLQPCWNNPVTSLTISTRLLQVVNSLFQTCWRLDCRLATSCEIFSCVDKEPLYNILPPNFAILFILSCSSKLWWKTFPDQNLVRYATFSLRIFQRGVVASNCPLKARERNSHTSYSCATTCISNGQNRLTFVYTELTFKITHMLSYYYISLRQRNGE